MIFNWQWHQVSHLSCMWETKREGSPIFRRSPAAPLRHWPDLSQSSASCAETSCIRISFTQKRNKSNEMSKTEKTILSSNSCCVRDFFPCYLRNGYFNRNFARLPSKKQQEFSQIRARFFRNNIPGPARASTSCGPPGRCLDGSKGRRARGQPERRGPAACEKSRVRSSCRGKGKGHVKYSTTKMRLKSAWDFCHRICASAKSFCKLWLISV